jgi:hypothetical protein
VTFRANGKAYDDVLYVDAMTRGDAGFVSFVNAVLSKLTAEVALPTSPESVDMEDAEDAVVEMLTALQTQVDLVVSAVGAKTDGRGAPQLAVDPRAQPRVLRPMVDSRGNFVVDQAKMVPQADGTYVEATTAETGAVKKNRSTMEVAQGYLLYWTGHPYHVGKFQTLLWRLVPKVTGDVLKGVITPLLQHVQELVNSGAADARTGDMALEYIMEKLAEQVNFAATLGQKRKADGPAPGGRTRSRRVATLW